jgi:hypothetical protein
MFSICVVKYRPHRPHRLECGCLQGFLAVGTKHCLPTAKDRYRPLRQIPPADRLPENEPFCRTFSSPLVIAGGAVGILTSFTDGLSSLSVYPSAEAISMYMASDYIHPTPRGGQCRVRIFLAKGEQDAPVVICSEHPNNGDTSVTDAAEQLAAEVIRSHRLPTPLEWIEHWPKQATDGEEETFELVVFSSYKVEERAPYLGETRAWIGDATWKTLDRAAVEALVEGKV